MRWHHRLGATIAVTLAAVLLPALATTQPASADSLHTCPYQVCPSGSVFEIADPLRPTSTWSRTSSTNDWLTGNYGDPPFYSPCDYDNSGFQAATIAGCDYTFIRDYVWEDDGSPGHQGCQNEPGPGNSTPYGPSFCNGDSSTPAGPWTASKIQNDDPHAVWASQGMPGYRDAPWNAKCGDATSPYETSSGQPTLGVRLSLQWKIQGATGYGSPAYVGSSWDCIYQPAPNTTQGDVYCGAKVQIKVLGPFRNPNVAAKSPDYAESPVYDTPFEEHFGDGADPDECYRDFKIPFPVDLKDLGEYQFVAYVWARPCHEVKTHTYYPDDVTVSMTCSDIPVNPTYSKDVKVRLACDGVAMDWDDASYTYTTRDCQGQGPDPVRWQCAFDDGVLLDGDAWAAQPAGSTARGRQLFKDGSLHTSVWPQPTVSGNGLGSISGRGAALHVDENGSPFRAHADQGDSRQPFYTSPLAGSVQPGTGSTFPTTWEFRLWQGSAQHDDGSYNAWKASVIYTFAGVFKYPDVSVEGVDTVTPEVVTRVNGLTSDTLPGSCETPQHYVSVMGSRNTSSDDG